MQSDHCFAQIVIVSDGFSNTFAGFYYGDMAWTLRFAWFLHTDIYVCLFFRPKARFSILRPHGLGHPLRQPRRLGPPFRQTSLYYGLKRSVPLQKPELRFVVVRWDPGGGAIGLPSGIIPRRYMSINGYPRISLRLLAWLLCTVE